MSKILRNIKLNKAEFLSLVDQGASGDGKLHRPRIVLTKRKATMTLKERIRRVFSKEKPEEEVKKSPQEMLEAALSGLPPEKQDEVLKVVADMVASFEKPAEPVASEKQEGEGEPTEKEGEPDPEDKKEVEMSKAQSEELKKAKDDLAKAQADIAKLKADADKAQAVAKAKETPFVPGSTDELAQLLSDAEGLPEASKTALHKLLKSTNEVLAKADAFQERGSGAPAAGSAEEKIEQLVKEKLGELRKAKGRRATREIAYNAVLQENPGLYKRFKQEQREGAH